MIASAHADGHLDDSERGRIFDRIDTLDLDAAEKGLLFDELRRPLGVGELAAVAGTPELPDARQAGVRCPRPYPGHFFACLQASCFGQSSDAQWRQPMTYGATGS